MTKQLLLIIALCSLGMCHPTQGSDCLIKGRELEYNGEYESAIAEVLSCMNQFENAGNFRGTVDACQMLARFYAINSQLDKAEYYAEKSLTMARDELGATDTLRSFAHIAKATVFNTSSTGYRKAISHADSAIAILEEKGTKHGLMLAEAYNNRGVAQFRLSEFDQAYTDYTVAHRLKVEILGENHPGIAAVLNDIAGVQFNKGDLIGVEKTLKDILSNLTANFPDGHPTMVKALSNISVVNLSLGNYHRSIEYLEQANVLQKRFFGKDKIQSGIINNFLAMNYWYLEMFGKAEHYFQRSLSIMEKNVGKKTQLYLLPLSNLAGMYVDMGKFDAAISWYLRSLDIYDVISPGGAPSATAYYGLGKAYLGKQELTQALQYFKRALALRKQLHGTGSLVARAHYRVGEVYAEQYALDSAMIHYQRAFAMITEGFTSEDPYEDPGVSPNLELMAIWNRKAHAFEKRFEQNRDVKELDRALELRWRSFEVMELSIRDFNSDKFRTWMGPFAQQGFEEGLELAMSLFELTGEKTYLNKACAIIERSKSQQLRAKFVIQYAESFSGIPDSLLNRERELRVNIAFYENTLARERSNPTIEDNPMVEQQALVLFEEKRRYQELIDFFEQYYSGYHRLKYKVSDFDVLKFQETLDDHEAMIEYFMGPSHAYAMYVDKDDYRVFDLGDKASIATAATQFRTVVSTAPSTSLADQLKHYGDASMALYSKVLAPITDVIGEDITRLIIVPDGELGYIPFEALSGDGDATNFASFNYLQNGYDVSYLYSASLVEENLGAPKALKGILAFAPDYNTHSNKDSAAFLSFRNHSLQPLLWNVQEVEDLESNYEATAYVNQQASEENFKAHAGAYRVLHLAMHSLVDELEPQNSRLVFSGDEGKSEDGSLHSFELRNLNLRADLAVLSACQTGYGKLEMGEGVLSLARSFAIAGVGGVVVTHWNVGDRTTNQLMGNFYHYLDKGLTRSEALRRGKMDYFEDAHASQLHPFYWAAFVAIGDNAAVFPGKLDWRVLGTVAGLSLLFLVVVFRKRL